MRKRATRFLGTRVRRSAAQVRYSGVRRADFIGDGTYIIAGRGK